jgi:prepilin-type N-terminal cleavage/methylation domain-containing protein
MNNSKGFTLLEMMVAAGLLVIALAGAMSFFIYQSQSGADSGKLKAARENISLALMLIQRDIMLAGYGVYGGGSVTNPKTLSMVLDSKHGVDLVNSDTFLSKDTTQWYVADLPRLESNVTNDPFLPAGTTFRPDKIYVGYGDFLDMNFDINSSNDTNTVFKHSAAAPLLTGGNSFTFDLFKSAIGMAVTSDTKPLGGFICDTCATTRFADVDWARTGNPVATGWNFFLTPGESLTPTTKSNVAPAIVYRIAKDAKRQTYELQRNGIRIAGGDPDMEVYNLTVQDQTQSPNTTLRFSIRIDYQVLLSGSKAELNLHGTDKKTWRKGWVTLGADPRTVVLNEGS